MSASATATRTNSPWSPTRRVRSIYQWVKFDGHTQLWVAEQLGIHQSTVSRIVERFELWLAHGGPAAEGAPRHDERLRAQRWLAYERNEWIIAACLRLAGEVQSALEATKSTIARTSANINKENQIRTETKMIDRTATAARFLRLAHRINMDQLDLVAQSELEPLEPLTQTDIDDFNQLATATDSASRATDNMDTSLDPIPAPGSPLAPREAFPPDAASSNPTRERGETSPDSASSFASSSPSTLDSPPSTPHSPPPHSPPLHTPHSLEPHVTPTPDSLSTSPPLPQKPSAAAYSSPSDLDHPLLLTVPLGAGSG